LAIMTGILSTLLSGASYGTQLGDMQHGAKPGHDGQIFIAVEISAFQPLETFKARVDEVSRQIQDSRRAVGIERLYPPGMLEAEFEKIRRESGIPLNDETIVDLIKTGQGVGVKEGDYLSSTSR
jgi:LDH2 family malate/lactate/ureidoglycolate dehydrogenase